MLQTNVDIGLTLMKEHGYCIRNMKVSINKTKIYLNES